MKHVPWLIIGMIVGTVVGCNAVSGYSHGPEDNELQVFRTLCGTGIGLIAGLLTDIALAIRRRRGAHQTSIDAVKETDVRQKSH